MKSSLFSVILSLATVFVFVACVSSDPSSPVANSDDDITSQTDFDSNTGTPDKEETPDSIDQDSVVEDITVTDDDSTTPTPDVDSAPVSGFDPNNKDIWIDPATKIAWEKNVNIPAVGGMAPTFAASEKYCNDLNLAGSTDWRVPTIDDLRTIVRGVSTTMTGGKCPTTGACTDQGKCHDDDKNENGFGYSCLGCQALDPKYDPSMSYLAAGDCQLDDRQTTNQECYRVPQLLGPCDGDWSSTLNTGLAGTAAGARWYLNFKRGLINSDSDILSGMNWVRCVRNTTDKELEGFTFPDDDGINENTTGRNPESCIRDIECVDNYWCFEQACVVKPEPSWKDTDTGYTWAADEVFETWEGGKKYCESLEIGSLKNWSLPTISELKSLVKQCSTISQCGIVDDCTGYTSCDGGSEPCKKGCGAGNHLPAQLGQNTQTYWSSTEETNNPSKGDAWTVNFQYGSVKYMNKGWNNVSVRCVHK